MRLSQIFKAGLGTAVVVQAASLIAEPNDISQQIEPRQQAAVIKTSDFLRRAKHASAICGNFVYIDGGDFSYNLSGVTNFQYASTILAVDLSTSWINSTVVIHSTSKPSGVPDLDEGSLWCNPQTGKLIAGLTGTAPSFMSTPILPSLNLWTFTPDNTGSGTWAQLLGSDSAALSSIVRPYSGQMAVGKDSAYILGGLTVPNVTVNSYLNGTPLSGILAFNMTTSTFTNSSADGYSPNGTAENGVLHYVPAFGPDGVFVAMGGDVSGLGSYTPGHNLKSFANLVVFDPSTGIFYNQTATGNLPEPRVQFCTAGVASTNGTYEIFLYAGWNTNLGSPAIPFDEVYILTLPAFEWIKVDYAPANPRHLHSCHTVGNRQMLIIGGVDSSKDSGAATLDEDTFLTQDIFAQGLGIFDMTALAFSDSYNASAEAYVQSDPVQSYYASNSKAPAAWGSSALEALFQITHFPNATTSTPASSSSATNSPSSKPKSSNTGAIAGGVIGGVVVLAIIAGAAYFCCRRRKKSSGIELPAAEPQTHFPQYSQLDGHEVKPVYETYGSQDASEQHRGVFGPDRKGNIELRHMSTRVELP